MSMEPSRRDFLKVSGLSLSAAALASGTPIGKLDYLYADRGALGEITVWITDEGQTLAQAPSLAWQQASTEPSGSSILIRPEMKFQEILGFGAAFTDAACYTFNRLGREDREELFHKLFHPSEMGLDVCRTCIGSSDYSTKLYSYDEGEADPELSRFSIEPDRTYILPILREARKVNPDLFLFSSPWSPPGWMKSNSSMLGGNMRRQYMPCYANYFVKFLKAYESEGVSVQAVTVQNEVDTDQDGRMPACIWPQEYEADFVRSYLGPVFERSGVKTKIWLIDHNYNLWGRAIGELETPGVRNYTNTVAWHGYVGKPEWIDRVQKACPDVTMHWTEGGPDYTATDYAKDWTDWSATFAAILRHWCCSITAWNFALDESGRPNIGPFSCGGLLTVHSQTKQVSYSGQFRALAHYSCFIRRRARRIDSQGAPDLHHVGFENQDGKQVLVVTNPGPSRTVQIRLAQKSATIPLSAKSVTSLQWSAE
jgi:glucosylceramidase